MNKMWYNIQKILAIKRNKAGKGYNMAQPFQHMVNEIHHKGTNIVRFHLYVIPRIGKIIEIKSRGNQGREKQGVIA